LILRSVETSLRISNDVFLFPIITPPRLCTAKQTRVKPLHHLNLVI
jgi:hypothetical protein